MVSILKNLRLLADSSRLRILLLLEREELSVAELQEILGRGQSRISTYLAQLKQANLPHLDQTWSALLSDLDQRGLLDETLVVMMSDFGRTPRVNGAAGRDHWTYCYSVVFAGAGIRGGTVCGASDGHAAYVKDRPVRPADVCATIYHCLGIDPDMPVHDRSGRPTAVAQGGKPIREILA